MENALHIYGLCPLAQAVKDSDDKAVENLLKEGVDPNSLAYTGREAVSSLHGYIRPIHLAVKEGNITILKLLVKYGANINIQDDEKKTPLHWAAKNAQIRSIKLLLYKGAQINNKDFGGKTALEYALGAANIEIPKLLILRGALISKGVTYSSEIHDFYNSVHNKLRDILKKDGFFKGKKDKEVTEGVLSFILNKAHRIYEWKTPFSEPQSGHPKELCLKIRDLNQKILIKKESLLEAMKDLHSDVYLLIIGFLLKENAYKYQWTLPYLTTPSLQPKLREWFGAGCPIDDVTQANRLDNSNRLSH